jgi:hypothetical protein
VSKRRVFVRQFPLLANGVAAGERQQYVSGGQQCLTFPMGQGRRTKRL